jgi:hypothetical protein
MFRDHVSLHRTINNCAFSGFFFSIFGWVLLHTWGFQRGAGTVLHAFTALIGFGLAAISFRRYRLYWAPFSNQPRPDQRRSTAAFNISDVGWGLLLLAIGNVIAQLILAGWVTPLALFSFGLTFVPWSKVPFCRSHFFSSCMLIGVGAACTLFVASNPAHPLFFPIASWVFWGSACVALLRK